MKTCPFPVVAVRALLKDRKGRILLLKRTATSYGNDQWCLPGGKVDYNESPEESVVREIKEETGISIVKVKFLFYQNSPPIDKGLMHCINLYFECSVTGKVIINKESNEYIWVSPSEALAFKPVFGGYEAVKRYRRDSLKKRVLLPKKSFSI
jgi:8-oxo-dGTP diphosphatase